MIFGYVAFYYQFWMYVYKYEFEENKGVCHVFILYILHRSIRYEQTLLMLLPI